MLKMAWIEIDGMYINKNYITAIMPNSGDVEPGITILLLGFDKPFFMTFDAHKSKIDEILEYIGASEKIETTVAGTERLQKPRPAPDVRGSSAGEKLPSHDERSSRGPLRRRKE